MKLQIKHRWTGAVLFEAEAESMKSLVEAAVKAEANLIGANLSEADLSRADLSRADLSRANLIGADLSRAYLSGANLSEADLSRANLIGANLIGANLSEADLSRADLSRAYLIGAYLIGADLSRADLSRAYLSGAIGYNGSDPAVEKLRVPVIENLPAKILEAIAKPGCSLEMSNVHVCETTHCIAGWTVHLAGKEGYDLEKKHGWTLAANMIWHKSHKGPRPSFYGSNENAMKQLKKCVERDAANA